MPRLTEGELAEYGERFGAGLAPHAVVALTGELGAGKTTLVQAIVRGLGVSGPATSPTYNLVHRYPAPRGPVFHLDCYRLRHPDEAADLDWEGILRDGDVLLVEWPERAGAWVPRTTHHFTLRHVPDDPDRRDLELT